MKKIILNSALVLVLIFIFAWVWEFIIEPNWLGSDDPETNAERWEYIYTSLFFCFVALIVPTIISIREWSKNQKALSEIKMLCGIIPICMYCKKIKGDKDVWDKLEAYIEEHSDADFTHGICPDCLKTQLEEVKRIKKE